MTTPNSEKQAVNDKFDATLATAKAAYNRAVADYARQKDAIAKARSQAMADLRARFAVEPSVSRIDKARRRALCGATAAKERLDAALARAQLRHEAHPKWIDRYGPNGASNYVLVTDKLDYDTKVAQARYGRDMALVSKKLKIALDTDSNEC
jgi:hypothetical protein